MTRPGSRPPAHFLHLAGDHLGVVCDAGVAIVDRTVGAEAATVLWEVLNEGPDLGVFLAALGSVSRRTLLDLPPFAIALWSGPSTDRRTHLAARGTGFVASASGDTDHAVAGTGAATWSERTVDGAQRIAVRATPPGDAGDATPAAPPPALPIVSGVAAARRLHSPGWGRSGAGTDPAQALLDARARHPAPRPGGVARPSDASATLHRPLPPLPAPPEEGIGTTRLGSRGGPVRSGGTSSGPGALPSVACGQGHPNPPHRTTCRVCGVTVTRDVRPVVAPARGRMTVSTGEVVEIDAPVVVGRSPRADLLPGPAAARLVAVPEGHVSATHVEVRPDGWQVVALDKRSTNGTFLRRPDREPLRLRDEPVVLASGDVLDLGHGAWLSFDELA
ncbi:FHA domain-containing protein [Nocardioides sp. CPCC 205120]|uniref:FHA domain-containing protein n=1 Tax=Nocardioides sp. CPCC 205120 TaxID=3406462 RepID=UPI003B508B97